MPRTWKRAEYQRQCGLCGGPIYRGDPYLELTSELWPTPKRRCQRWKCAEEEPPADLPDLEPKAPLQPMPLTRFSEDTLPLDFKHKAANDD